ncbi:hypothetical protein ACIP2X_25650 [Streptomyces sp. NPDC089424]|uniref:hypothetical protein n=1 Tax=Streptomyces sp. NPDC089424 TaxID=3365917 RepID=UPI00380391E6
MRQTAMRERAGDRREESGHVFTTQTGRPIEPRNVHRSFTRVAKNADLRVIRLHDVRAQPDRRHDERLRSRGAGPPSDPDVKDPQP